MRSVGRTAAFSVTVVRTDRRLYTGLGMPRRRIRPSTAQRATRTPPGFKRSQLLAAPESCRFSSQTFSSSDAGSRSQTVRAEGDLGVMPRRVVAQRGNPQNPAHRLGP